MPYAAWVRRSPDIAPNARSFGPVTGKHVGILFPGEVSQFVKADKGVLLPLILLAILGMLHGAEIDSRSRWEDPDMFVVIVPRAWVAPTVQLLGTCDKLLKLREGFTEE
jgi:hypothetical protein